MEEMAKELLKQALKGKSKEETEETLEKLAMIHVDFNRVGVMGTREDVLALVASLLDKLITEVKISEEELMCAIIIALIPKEKRKELLNELKLKKKENNSSFLEKALKELIKNI